MSTNPLLARLRHHVTGAVERGEAQAIVGMPVNTFRATINVARYEVAKSLAVAWSRYSHRGYSLSPRNAEGGATLTLDGVTDADRAWIDQNAANLNNA